MPLMKQITSVQHEIDFVNRSLDRWEQFQGFEFGIFTRSDDLYLGNIGVHDISWAGERCQIGYWILGRHEGQGYVTEATQALCNVLLGHGFNRIEIRCNPRNIRSSNIPRSLGFKFEARLAQLRKDDSGLYHDSQIFARLKSQGPVVITPQMKIPKLRTPHLILRLPTQEDIPEIMKYFSDNESHLSQFSPKNPPGFGSLEFWQERITQHHENFFADRSLRLFLFSLKNDREVIGTLEFSHISRGPFQACYLGYNIAAIHQGQGLMFEAVTAAIRYAFEVLNIHRIMANHLPENERSAKLLKRLGFQREYIAKDYLQINGQWRDHVLNSLHNSQWTVMAGGR